MSTQLIKPNYRFHTARSRRRRRGPSYLHRVYVFEDYGVNATRCDTENSLQSAKEKMAKKLKKDLQDGEHRKTGVRHYIRIPHSSQRKGHAIGETRGWCNNIGTQSLQELFFR